MTRAEFLCANDARECVNWAQTGGAAARAGGTRWARVSRAVKWSVTCVAAAVTFGVCLWLAMAVELPFLPKAEADRWVVAAAFAGMMATAVAACGTWWAARENRPGAADGDPAGAGQQITGAAGSLQFGA